MAGVVGDAIEQLNSDSATDLHLQIFIAAMPEPDVASRNLRRAVVQSLQSWQSSGLTHLSAPRPAVGSEASPNTLPGSDSHDMTEAAVPPHSTEVRRQALSDLAERVAACRRCEELAQQRTQTVFGVGNPDARVMFIGEAPGADEDRQGEPFVGRAGQLLTRIISACGWDRGDIYICNILRCRPPGNRNPTTQEADNCREHLDGQISIVGPEFIVCWGSVAAQNLLGVTDPIGRMRGRWFSYGAAKVLCTYHPSYLLRNASAKKPVWEDMLFLLKEMGIEPPPHPKAKSGEQ
jgi:DNA polymerase